MSRGGEFRSIDVRAEVKVFIPGWLQELWYYPVWWGRAFSSVAGHDCPEWIPNPWAAFSRRINLS
jgi:hypothetical protein